MTHMGGEWGWQGDRGQAMAGGYAVAQPGGRGITSQSPSVCPAGPGEEKEHKEEPCGRADGLRVIKAIKSVSGVRRGGGSSLQLMNGEWRGRGLFKGLLPGFGVGVELNGVTGGRETVTKGALGSADKSRCVSCLSAVCGLGSACWHGWQRRPETCPW